MEAMPHAAWPRTAHVRSGRSVHAPTWNGIIGGLARANLGVSQTGMRTRGESYFG